MRFVTNPGLSSDSHVVFSVFGEGMSQFGDIVSRLLADHDLDALHDRNRVHEVQPDHALRVFEVGRDRGDRERARVRREDGVVDTTDRIEVSEDVAFDREILEGRFDDDITVLEVLEGRSCR